MNILVPPIMLTIKPRIVTKFWAHSSISCIQLMSFWCPFLVPHLTTHHSNIGVRLGPLTLYHKNYKCKIQGFAVCLWQIVLPKSPHFSAYSFFFKTHPGRNVQQQSICQHSTTWKGIQEKTCTSPKVFLLQHFCCIWNHIKRTELTIRRAAKLTT